MAKIDKILGSISPLYGIASGEGLFSNMRKISPFMHMIGEGSTNAEKRRRAAQGDKKAAEEIAVEDAAVKDMKQAPAMKRGGAVKKMASGGPVKKPVPTPAERAASKAQDERLKNAKVTKEEVRTLNSANRSEGGMPKYAKGGSASSRADGCATKGKTRGKIY